MTDADLESLRSWEGRRQSDSQIIDARTAARMAGALGLERTPREGDALPMPWHWLYFTPIDHARATGEDGHPVKGGFLPPVPLPQRMWAGSQVTCHRPLIIGEAATKTSAIEKVTAKSGKSGNLVFVTVKHQIHSASGDELLTEYQDIVYRERFQPQTIKRDAGPVPKVPPVTPHWRSSVTPHPVLLFRYSALTFNCHRIHYDRDYAVRVEGYPGLVVHGPLTASLLLNLMYDHLGTVEVAAFSFRGLQPLFDLSSFNIEGVRKNDIVELQADTPEGETAMQLAVTLRSAEGEEGIV